MKQEHPAANEERTSADVQLCAPGPLAGPPVRRRLRVLNVEDSPDDADLLLRELRRGGYEPDTLRVQTAEEMRAALRERAWDVVISDHSLPTFSAPAAFAVMREMGLDLPFIMVSGTVGEDVAVEAMRIGVHDYILKGNLRRLVAAIERELREAAMRAEQRTIREQLMISERMASVGTLAAGVAHEINNPLSVIIGNLDCAVSELTRADGEAGGGAALAERLRGPLADARDAAERVRLIVRDLRLFSRADAEARGPVDVRRVLESSLSMARNEIRHRAHVARDFQDVPPVHANESRLCQVFLNLLINAAQSIPEGRSADNTITVVTRRAAGRVVVEIMDTGAGIPADVLPRIFDVFFTTKPMGVGTGLGLAICHRIVTAVGGEITVQSRPGAGTTVRVTLPPSRSLRAADVAAVAPPPPPAARRAAMLIIEDEVAVGRMLQRLLMSSYQVTVVASGREALDKVGAGARFDVILCDLMMPEMTGMDLHAELSRCAPALARRIVFMSGGAFTPRAREFLDQVDNPRVDKPVDLVRLRKLVDEMVAPEPSGAGARPPA